MVALEQQQNHRAFSQLPPAVAIGGGLRPPGHSTRSPAMTQLFDGALARYSVECSRVSASEWAGTHRLGPFVTKVDVGDAVADGWPCPPCHAPQGRNPASRSEGKALCSCHFPLPLSLPLPRCGEVQRGAGAGLSRRFELERFAAEAGEIQAAAKGEIEASFRIFRAGRERSQRIAACTSSRSCKTFSRGFLRQGVVWARRFHKRVKPGAYPVQASHSHSPAVLGVVQDHEPGGRDVPEPLGEQVAPIQSFQHVVLETIESEQRVELSPVEPRPRRPRACGLTSPGRPLAARGRGRIAVPAGAAIARPMSASGRRGD